MRQLAFVGEIVGAEVEIVVWLESIVGKVKGVGSGIILGVFEEISDGRKTVNELAPDEIVGSVAEMSAINVEGNDVIPVVNVMVLPIGNGREEVDDWKLKIVSEDIKVSSSMTAYEVESIESIVDFVAVELWNTE